MDVLKLNGIRCFGTHGVLPEEAKLGQWFVTSLEVALDLREAARADDPALTVDYTELIAVVREVVEGPRCALIEAVAERIAGSVLERFPCVRRVTVEFVKPNPPVPVSFEGAAVVLIRERASDDHS